MVNKRKVTAILEALDRSDDLLERQEVTEARDVLLQARTDWERAGGESGFLSWRLAVVFDLLKEYEVSFKYAQDAILQDPLAPPFRSSFGIAARALRKAILESPGQPGAAEFVPRMYDLLVHAGEGDDAVHVAMARHLHGLGEHQRALKLVNAVTLLSPGEAEAWLLRAAICRALGDEQAAREADVEAAAVGEPAPVMFSVPGATA